VVVRTPLLPSDALSEELRAEVRLKCESLQRAGSFKARGAQNFVLQLPDEQVAGGVITYSSGNHAQAVALAARTRGVPALVVMPTTAPRVKVEGARRLGAEVVFEGTTSVERKRRAEAIADERRLCMVPPFDHSWIIAGQGTVGLEIVEDFEDVDLIVAPIGGGGLCSGTAAAVRRLRPDARVVGVEPEGAASMRAALDAGRTVELERVETVADGLAPVRAGELTFEHVRELVDEVVTVDDVAIQEATALLLHRHKLVVEFSGAASVAALRRGRIEGTEGSKVCAVLSGGNLDPQLMRGLGDGALGPSGGAADVASEATGE
jgi:threonine dehydratase